MSSAPPQRSGRPQLARRPPQKKEKIKSDSKTGLGERETSSSPYDSECAADRHPGDAGANVSRLEQGLDGGRDQEVQGRGRGHRDPPEGFGASEPGERAG